MRTVLIANRSEIALRILHACAERGIATVAVYADADADAPYVHQADAAYALEGESAAGTYLDAEKLIAIGRRAGATDVHPGYGFLSESADFARAVVAAGMRWIGPSAETIEALGDKIRARAIAMAAGAPLAPGTDGPLESAEQAREFAQEHGLPVIIKAAHGGGGRGMRVVRELAEVEQAFESAAREATSVFGRGECFVERFLERPRHVEAQVVADERGGVLVLGTRDCSLQRRNQKLVEEAPAPFLAEGQRRTIEDSAAAIYREAGYVGAGTCEFLVGADGLISFLEANTRIQVEHPVTEEAYGVDLVGLQLDVAAGEPLPFDQAPPPRGHSLEFRINAEDPARGFLPAGGRITGLSVPTGPGIRLDSGVAAGSEVTGDFDSLLAKLVVTGPTRERALARARHALREMAVGGVATTLPFHRAVLDRPEFTAAGGVEDFRVHTTWIEDSMGPALEPEGGYAAPHHADAAAYGEAPHPDGSVVAAIELDGRLTRVRVPSAALRELGEGLARQWGGGLPDGRSGRVPGGAADAGADGAPGGNGPRGDGRDGAEDGVVVSASLGGTLLRWEAAEGAAVQEGQRLAVLEAMKTEMPLEATVAGTFHRSDAEPGARIAAHQVLGRIS